MTSFNKIQRMLGKPAVNRAPARAKRTWYFAYGANTNLQSMAARCPLAVPMGTLILQDHRLVFDGVADIEEAKGFNCHGALWSITAECERSLDRFEGFPNLYVKTMIEFEHEGRTCEAMAYIMRSRRGSQGMPSSGYEKCLREGYGSFNMPLKQIDRAIARVREAQQKREAQLAKAFRTHQPMKHEYDWLTDPATFLSPDDDVIPESAFTDHDQPSLWEDDLADLGLGSPQKRRA